MFLLDCLVLSQGKLSGLDRDGGREPFICTLSGQSHGPVKPQGYWMDQLADCSMALENFLQDDEAFENKS